MTNEQSMQNIDTVKKLLHLYENNCVYLQFKNETEFEIIRLPKLDDNFHSAVIEKHRELNLPYAHLWQPTLRKDPHVRYADVNLSFMLNLTTSIYSITFNDAPEDLNEVREEYLELIKSFK